MTKEELEKEAREYIAEHSEYSEVFGQTFVTVDTLTAMVDFTEPREKQIQIDAEQIRALQKQNGELTDKLNNLASVAEVRLANWQKYEKENKELKERLLKVENAYKRKSDAEWRLNDLYQKIQTDFANAEKCSREYFTRYRIVLDKFIKAKELLGKLLVYLKRQVWIADKPIMQKDIAEAEQFIKENE